MLLLKSMLSLIFMCQFCYSFELVQLKFAHEGKIFDADAKLSASIALSRTITSCALILMLQRVAEFVLYACLKMWAHDKTNFKQLKVGLEKSSNRRQSLQSHCFM